VRFGRRLESAGWQPGGWAGGRAARRYQKPLFRRRGGNGGYLLLLKQLDVFK